MKNLEQIRAAHALKHAQSLDRSAVNKLPAMILANGLLATAAFCDAEGGGDNRKDMKKAMDATADHLQDRGLVKLDKSNTKESSSESSTKAMIKDLSKRDSHHLQAATSEALAFIAYLKRFASKKD